MNKAMNATLYYVHDPMCSWCWGYRPVWQALSEQLPDSISIEYLLGGLAPDSDEPMPEPLQQQIIDHWRRIQNLLGTEFNFDFWRNNQPRRSTYPACRAVIAAGRQGRGEEMIEAIQHAYYLQALNPSDSGVLAQLAAELALDTTAFAAELISPDTDAELHRQIALVNQLPVSGFPSLVLVVNGATYPVELDYRDTQITLNSVTNRMRCYTKSIQRFPE